IPGAAAEADAPGFVVLTRGADIRRIPYWLHVERPKLGKPVRTLTKSGNYAGDSRKGRAAVSTYRYPEGVPATVLAGPEQVFAVKLKAAATNFGVRVTSGAKVIPHIVRDGDENRVTGDAGFPGGLNPYLGFGDGGTPVA